MSIPKEAKPPGKIFSKKLKTGVDICQIRAITKHLAEVNSQSEREYADVAELADALDSGSSGSDTVGVQVPSSAPKSRMLLHSGFFCLLSTDFALSARFFEREWRIVEREEVRNKEQTHHTNKAPAPGKMHELPQIVRTVQSLKSMLRMSATTPMDVYVCSRH